MTTPPGIAVGQVWELINDLGVGLGMIEAGAQVTIADVLPPFSPGVVQVNENVIVAEYRYMDYVYDDYGNMVEAECVRFLAYPESQFRQMFDGPVSG